MDTGITLTRAQTRSIARMFAGYGERERVNIRPMVSTGACFVTFPHADGPLTRRIAADGSVGLTLVQRREQARGIAQGPPIPARIGPGREVS